MGLKNFLHINLVISSVFGHFSRKFSHLLYATHKIISLYVLQSVNYVLVTMFDESRHAAILHFGCLLFYSLCSFDKLNVNFITVAIFVKQ